MIQQTPFSFAKPSIPPYSLVEPEAYARLPVFYDSPHSGSHYPEDFRPCCDMNDLKQAEDHFIDALFDHVPQYGATFLKANFPRSYIDPNRSPHDIDPDMLSAPWHEPVDPYGRSLAGHGLIRRYIRTNTPVYNRLLSPHEIQHRINEYYTPYHNALSSVINKLHYNFGSVLHINCHSMPASAAVTREKGSLPIGSKIDFCLGNLNGASCTPEVIDSIKIFLIGRGYRVSTNDPYKGVEILKRHGNVPRNIQSIQLEINKSLYMNERNNNKSSDYNALQHDIESLSQHIASLSQTLYPPIAAD